MSDRIQLHKMLVYERYKKKVSHWSEIDIEYNSQDRCWCKVLGLLPQYNQFI